MEPLRLIFTINYADRPKWAGHKGCSFISVAVFNCFSCDHFGKSVCSGLMNSFVIEPRGWGEWVLAERRVIAS